MVRWGLVLGAWTVGSIPVALLVGSALAGERTDRPDRREQRGLRLTGVGLTFAALALVFAAVRTPGPGATPTPVAASPPTSLSRVSFLRQLDEAGQARKPVTLVYVQAPTATAEPPIAPPAASADTKVVRLDPHTYAAAIIGTADPARVQALTEQMGPTVRTVVAPAGATGEALLDAAQSARDGSVVPLPALGK